MPEKDKCAVERLTHPRTFSQKLMKKWNALQLCKRSRGERGAQAPAYAQRSQERSGVAQWQSSSLAGPKPAKWGRKRKNEEELGGDGREGGREEKGENGSRERREKGQRKRGRKMGEGRKRNKRGGEQKRSERNEERFKQVCVLERGNEGEERKGERRWREK